MVRFALVAVAALFIAPEAQAQCAAQAIDTLTCTSVIVGRLRPGAWGAGDVPGQALLGSTCPDGFNTLNNDLGASCTYTNSVFGCLGSSCSPDVYGCGAPFANVAQDGPDDVYAFNCQQSGDVTVEISNMDCDLDIYVLDSTCDTTNGCVAGSTAPFNASDSVTFTCTLGETYYVVVEGYGETFNGYNSYTGGAGYCSPENPFSDGNYELAFLPGDPATSGCVEICDDLIDNESDGLTDCDDPVCPADPVGAGAVEADDSGLGDDGGGRMARDDHDCAGDA
ncbi:MAG: hypothetical protein GWP91_05095, partial [Rhodobacterales bacterium]|nr:hypothetical protein [Rhodobacterales bacterium]